jgi:hypothetical protein
MTSAGICLYCGARIRARNVLRVSRRRPYICAACHCESVIVPSSGMRIVLGWVMALALPLSILDYFEASRVELFTLSAGASIVIPLIFARFCRFEASTPIARVVPNDAK